MTLPAHIKRVQTQLAAPRTADAVKQAIYLLAGRWPDFGNGCTWVVEGAMWDPLVGEQIRALCLLLGRLLPEGDEGDWGPRGERQSYNV